MIGNSFFIDDDDDHDTDKAMKNVSVSFLSNQMGLCLPNLFQRVISINVQLFSTAGALVVITILAVLTIETSVPYHLELE